MGYANAGKGLKTMFKAEIGAIICAVIMIIPIIGTIIGGIGMVVFSIMSIYGLYVASQDFAGLKTAFLLTIANLVLSLLALIPVVGTFFSLVSSVVSMMIIYFVCNSMSDSLIGMGHADVSSLGKTVWKIVLVCTILDVIFTLIGLIPLIGFLAKVLNVFVSIVSFVGSIMYLVYLSKASKVF